MNRLKTEPSSEDDYIFPILTNEMSHEEKHKRIKQLLKNINKHIRVIAKEIGLDKDVTTYFARHSFSTVLKRSGASTEFISEQLGHQNLKTTQSYLDSFQDEVKVKYANTLTDF